MQFFKNECSKLCRTNSNTSTQIVIPAKLQLDNCLNVHLSIRDTKFIERSHISIRYSFLSCNPCLCAWIRRPFGDFNKSRLICNYGMFCKCADDVKLDASCVLVCIYVCSSSSGNSNGNANDNRTAFVRLNLKRNLLELNVQSNALIIIIVRVWVSVLFSIFGIVFAGTPMEYLLLASKPIRHPLDLCTEGHIAWQL